MRVSQVNNTSFTGSVDLKKGKQAFESLSRTEQAGKLGAEMFRQNFNRKNIGFKLSQPEGNLADYVRFKVAISNAIKKVTEKYRKPNY